MSIFQNYKDHIDLIYNKYSTSDVLIHTLWITYYDRLTSYLIQNVDLQANPLIMRKNNHNPSPYIYQNDI